MTNSGGPQPALLTGPALFATLLLLLRVLEEQELTTTLKYPQSMWDFHGRQL
jgi:hypothetical protein